MHESWPAWGGSTSVGTTPLLLPVAEKSRLRAPGAGPARRPPPADCSCPPRAETLHGRRPGGQRVSEGDLLESGGISGSHCQFLSHHFLTPHLGGGRYQSARMRLLVRCPNANVQQR